MKKLLLILFSMGISSPVLAAGPYDGSYEGTRELTYAAGSCMPTYITAEVTDGQVKMRLTYNGALLTGTLNRQGRVVLTGVSTNAPYRYRFEGAVKGKTFSGKWEADPRHCAGTWSMKKL